MHFSKNRQSIFRDKKGFTVIEVIVAIGLFGFAATIAMGAVISLLNSNSKSQTLATVMGNLNYAVDGMARTIRFATTYHCGTGGDIDDPQVCDKGGTFLAASTESGSQVIYRFQNNRLETSVDGGSSYTRLTGDDVTIQYGQFYVFNTTVDDDFQPYVVIVMKGYAGSRPSDETIFTIQTSISQRGLNISGS